MDKILICFPFIAAIIAYISSLRSLFWFSEKVEKSLSKNIKVKLIRRLDSWWEIITKTPFPVLAKKESEIVVRKLNQYLNDKKRSKHIKLNLSIFLTLFAWFIGNIFFVISCILFDNQEIHIDEKISSLLWICLLSVILYFLYKALMNPDERIKLMFNWLLRDIYFGFLVNSILLPLISEKLTAESYFIDSNFWVAIIGLILIVLFEVIIARNKTYTIKRFFLFSALIITFLSIAKSFDYFDLIWRIKDIYYNHFPWVLNYVFDLITFLITFRILNKIIEGKTLINILWILIDVFLAGILAITLYFILLYLNNMFEGVINNNENLDKIFIYSKEAISKNRFHNIIYASTTLIPTILYFFLLKLSYLGKIVELYLGKISKYIFYRPREDEKRTPVYLTLILISVVLSFVPAIISFIAAKKAMF